MGSKGSVSRVGKSAARERARLAKATLDVERAQREKKIEDAATAFYIADDAREAARQAVDQAESAMAAAIAELIEQEETMPRVATLCGIDVSEVRRLRKLTGSSAAQPAENHPAPVPEGVRTESAAGAGQPSPEGTEIRHESAPAVEDPAPVSAVA